MTADASPEGNAHELTVEHAESGRLDRSGAPPRYNGAARPRLVPTPLSPARRPPSPLVFAHRGGRALGPENTIAAFDRGLAAGADGLELDVHLSRDGVPVVHHDAELDRCTDAAGPVRAYTAAELARADAAYHFLPEQGHPWRGRGASIPTLAEVLARYPVPTIVEVKAYEAAAAHAVADVVRAAGAADRVCIGSFDPATLGAVRTHDPSLATSGARPEVQWALYRSWLGLSPGHVPYRAFQVPETAGWLRVVSRRFVWCAHRAALAVQVWTVNEEPDMRRLLRWGVDGLITDCPDVAVRVRDAWVGGGR
jgi:glycerophosphoryl diester phosphodiesterase